MNPSSFNRRRFLRAAARAGGGLALAGVLPLPAWAQSGTPGLVPSPGGTTATLPTVAGDDIALRIARQTMTIDGRASPAIGINGSAPGPLIRLREGQRARFAVTNALDESSSIHWHGLLVPAQYDGVPGVSFPGIPAGETFVYEFPVKQAGTYWYHSHSGLQEQLGHYGPIVIDPAGPDPVAFDREHVVVLSDHSQMAPEVIFRKMKQQPGYFNHQQQTLVGLLAGKDQGLKERFQWARMRMDPTDIADGNGVTYTFLVNGHGPGDNWTGLFSPGERVRLRIINASSMSTFDVRIPGLPMTVVQADGQNVRPVTVDEFQIGVAETYDVVVTPGDQAYTLVGEAVDRSGMARATLAPRLGMVAAVPNLRRRPLATMKDMGMGGMSHGMDMPGGMKGMDMSGGPMAMDHAAAAEKPMPTDGAVPPSDVNMLALPLTQGPGATPAAVGGGGGVPRPAPMPGMAMDMGGMDMNMRDMAKAPQVADTPGVQNIASMPVDRTDSPGQGLHDAPHRVLNYRDLASLEKNPDPRAPSRTLDVHLTGNMERFMWSFDGVKMSDAMTPLAFRLGERVRVRLINDTMMAHPIHLHGHFFEVVNGQGDHAPRKHTVIVQPGGVTNFDLTADAEGDWAFHCHLLYHMHAGMMRVVSVRPAGDAA